MQRMTLVRLGALVAGTVGLALTVGCGSFAGTDCSSASTAATSKLTVFAAASLTEVLPQIADAFRETHADAQFAFNFAGTDTLTAQIRQGAPADVFAGASSKYGDELSQEGLVDTPSAFATNRLVAIVPAANPAGIASLADLARPGVKLVIGDSTSPFGIYTRQMLAALDSEYGTGYSEGVLKNVVSNALQVTAVLTSVELGEADAGVVYVTDAARAGGKVASIEIPAAAQVAATYPIAVVKGSENGALAAQFVAYVLGPDAQALLRQSGFGPPSE